MLKRPSRALCIQHASELELEAYAGARIPTKAAPIPLECTPPGQGQFGNLRFGPAPSAVLHFWKRALEAQVQDCRDEFKPKRTIEATDVKSWPDALEAWRSLAAKGGKYIPRFRRSQLEAENASAPDVGSGTVGAGINGAGNVNLVGQKHRGLR